MEPRYNEVPRDWQNVFVITRFRYIEVRFHIFYYYSGKQNRSLYRGLRYMEVRYIKVSLYEKKKSMRILSRARKVPSIRSSGTSRFCCWAGKFLNSLVQLARV